MWIRRTLTCTCPLLWECRSRQMFLWWICEPGLFYQRLEMECWWYLSLWYIKSLTVYLFKIWISIDHTSGAENNHAIIVAEFRHPDEVRITEWGHSLQSVPGSRASDVARRSSGSSAHTHLTVMRKYSENNEGVSFSISHKIVSIEENIRGKL